mgnify:CR=1 FL=1
MVGGIQNEGGDPNNLNCDPVEGAPYVPDPLESLPDVEPAPALALPAQQLARDYLDDLQRREPFSTWLGELWAAKDAELAALKGEALVDSIPRAA